MKLSHPRAYDVRTHSKGRAPAAPAALLQNQQQEQQSQWSYFPPHRPARRSERQASVVPDRHLHRVRRSRPAMQPVLSGPAAQQRLLQINARAGRPGLSIAPCMHQQHQQQNVPVLHLHHDHHSAPPAWPALLWPAAERQTDRQPRSVQSNNAR